MYTIQKGFVCTYQDKLHGGIVQHIPHQYDHIPQAETKQLCKNK